jgi:hypothetical protein
MLKSSGFVPDIFTGADVSDKTAMFRLAAPQARCLSDGRPGHHLA